MSAKFNLKAYASAYEWRGITFWLLPYRGLQTDLALDGLEAIHPQWLYTDSTGKQTHDEPEAYRAARLRAGATGAPLPSTWKQQRLWGGIENIFYMAESMTVDVDFPPGDLKPELRAFAAYWKMRPSAFAERWAAFQQLVSTRIANAWWEAYEATRDQSMDAPEALQSEVGKGADPNAGARTSAPSTSSSGKSSRSPKPK